MDNEALKIKLIELHPSLTMEDSIEWVTAFINPAEWSTLAEMLRNDPDLHFDYLFCVTCVDWKTFLTMVYHLTSTIHRHTIVIKCKLDRNFPEIGTVSHIWRTAEFHEREAYDLFGVVFLDHPDLRRLFLTDDWVGWPLRKDYDDPVNMIKL